MVNNTTEHNSQQSLVFDKTVTKRVTCNYLLFLPEGYGKTEKHWPLILYLHGYGQRGDDLEQIKVNGLAGKIETDKSLPFVIVSPQCPENREWWSDDVVINLLDHIIANYDIDERRVYLTGLSMGGFETWRLACEYPDRFAAIAPICGGGEPLATESIKDIPIWAFHGANDDVVPLIRSIEMVDAVNKFGGDAKLTIYPGAHHESWEQTYANEELYEWFLKHSRK